MAQWINNLLQCRRCSRHSSISGLVKSPGEGNGNPLQYSFLENPMDRGAWWVTVHRVAKSQTWLRPLGTHTCREREDFTSLSLSPFFKKNLFLIERQLFCNIVLVSAIHQYESTIGLHKSPPSWPSLLPPHRTPLGCYEVPVWAPWVIQQIPPGCLFYIWWCMCFHDTVSICPTFSFPSCPQVCSLMSVSPPLPCK